MRSMKKQMIKAVSKQMGLFTGIFGANAYSNRELKRIEPIKNKVLALDEEYAELSDAELKAKTQEFKERLEDGETLDDILPRSSGYCP